MFNHTLAQKVLILLLYTLIREARVAAAVEKKTRLEARHVRLALRMKAPIASSILAKK